MSDEHKDGGCCSTPKDEKKAAGCGCCCNVKKLLIGILIIGLAFMAGFLFAKGCPVGQKMCPMGGSMGQ